jgi:hypothetical protein
MSARFGLLATSSPTYQQIESACPRKAVLSDFIVVGSLRTAVTSHQRPKGIPPSQSAGNRITRQI